MQLAFAYLPPTMASEAQRVRGPWHFRFKQSHWAEQEGTQGTSTTSTVTLEVQFKKPHFDYAWSRLLFRKAYKPMQCVVCRAEKSYKTD
jgi:hypothetical protein